VSLDDDTLFFFNYRSDRMREIVAVFGLPDKPMDVNVPNNLVSEILPALALCLNSRQDISTMSRYKLEWPFKVAFPPQAMTNVLAETLSKHGVKQCHIAGEKEAAFF
jgi:2,3-bisphosphoglycerate-independent phosphoglycerate mutase